MARNVVGPRIRQARLEHKDKLTQEMLSARLQTENVDLGANSVGKIEMGDRPVTDLQLLAFAKVLDVSPLWLLGLTENKNFKIIE